MAVLVGGTAGGGPTVVGVAWQVCVEARGSFGWCRIGGSGVWGLGQDTLKAGIQVIRGNTQRELDGSGVERVLW